ncbi:MAG TPA: GerMN domain-containing protein [Acidobacteriaceae bacterium]|jgi:hypothetical protein
MISRAQKYLFGFLLLVCVVMAVFLIRLRNRAQDRLQAEGTGVPQSIAEPGGSPPKTVTLFVPNDLDDSMVAVERTIPLPADENAQARVLLETLIEAYRAPDSTHPLHVEKGVDDVYFVPVPEGKGGPGGEMAVVDLNGALAAAQPSGIEPETLTLLSMMATLNANLPDVTEVHFLVDGQARETLAGHADLTRTYLAAEAEQRPSPAEPAGGGR